MATNTNQIEKQVLLRAPIERVWRAISDAEEFGRWFGARFEGRFEAGARVPATIQPTEVDPEIARSQAPYAGMRFDILVDRVEAPHHLSFRWHPGADSDEKADDARTLVTFDLEEVPDGTRLTIRETGFERIALERRAQVFEENEGGWEAQATLIEKYLARAA
ncbi:MAG: SRPBCC family protein [Longimicrobiales bacterium]